MMRVFATQVINVQRHQGMIDEALKKFMREVDIKTANHGTFEGHVKFQSGTARKIDHNA